jgi:aminoglycoside 6'-N-acetyltransferase
MSNRKISFRSATIDDLKTLNDWDEQPHVLDSDPDDDWNWEVELKREPAWRKQIMAELDSKPLGFIQIIDAAEEETHYWGAVPPGIAAIDIWIGDEKNLGKGYGTVMMQYAIELCFADEHINEILIDPLASNLKVHRFYEKMRFRFVREQEFNGINCFVYSLQRENCKNK